MLVVHQLNPKLILRLLQTILLSIVGIIYSTIIPRILLLIKMFKLLSDSGLFLRLFMVFFIQSHSGYLW
jgi:hypothetical protein